MRARSTSTRACTARLPAGAALWVGQRMRRRLSLGPEQYDTAQRLSELLATANDGVAQQARSGTHAAPRPEGVPNRLAVGAVGLLRLAAARPKLRSGRSTDIPHPRESARTAAAFQPGAGPLARNTPYSRNLTGPGQSTHPSPAAPSPDLFPTTKVDRAWGWFRRRANPEFHILYIYIYDF